MGQGLGVDALGDVVLVEHNVVGEANAAGRMVGIGRSAGGRSCLSSTNTRGSHLLTNSTVSPALIDRVSGTKTRAPASEPSLTTAALADRVRARVVATTPAATLLPLTACRVEGRVEGGRLGGGSGRPGGHYPQ